MEIIVINKKVFCINVLLLACITTTPFKSDAMEDVTRIEIAPQQLLRRTAPAMIQKTTGLNPALSRFILTSLTGNIKLAVIEFTLDKLVSYISKKMGAQKSPDIVPMIFDHCQSMDDFVAGYDNFRKLCSQLAKDDLQALKQQYNSADLASILDRKKNLTELLQQRKKSHTRLQQSLKSYAEQNKLTDFKKMLCNDHQKALQHRKNIPDNILKNMLSYDASVYSSKTLIDNVEHSLAYIDGKKNSIIYSEISPFIETLPHEQSKLQSIRNNLTHEISALQSDEYIKTLDRMSVLCDQTIQKCLDQKRRRTAESIAQGKKSYQKTLDEHQKKLLLAQAKQDVVDKYLAKF